MVTTKFNIPDDSALAAGVGVYPVLPDGDYEMAVSKIELTNIKNGVNVNAPAFNVQLRTKENRVFYKLIPLWAATGNTNGDAWLRMSRVAFVKALGITNEVLYNEPESLINMVVTSRVTSKNNAQGVLENSIVTFK